MLTKEQRDLLTLAFGLQTAAFALKMMIGSSDLLLIVKSVYDDLETFMLEDMGKRDSKGGN